MYICTYEYVSIHIYIYIYIYVCAVFCFLCFGLLACGFECNVCIQDFVVFVVLALFLHMYVHIYV